VDIFAIGFHENNTELIPLTVYLRFSILLVSARKKRRLSKEDPSTSEGTCLGFI